MERLALLFGSIFLFLFTHSSMACRYTPAAWQQVVEKHANPLLIGQTKNVGYRGDRDGDFIDDRITGRFTPADSVDVTLQLSTCLPIDDILQRFRPFGQIAYVGKLVTFVMLDGVSFERIRTLAELPVTAMVEWRTTGGYQIDTSSRAVGARASIVYPTAAIEALGLTGAGVNVAIVDSGVSNIHSAFAGAFVAGFDADRFEDSNANGVDDSCEPVPTGDGDCTGVDDEPGDGLTDSAVVAVSHGTGVAGVALARPILGQDGHRQRAEQLRVAIARNTVL